MFAGFVCASLDDQVHRRKTFARPFSDPAQFQFVPAIDGRNWSVEECEPYLSPEMVERWRLARNLGKRYFSTGLIACTLTHRDRLYPAAELGDRILCEDDVVVDSAFIDLWQGPAVRAQFNALGERGPLLLYYTTRGEIVAEQQPVARIGRYAIHRLKPSSRIASTACYYLHPQLAKRLREVQAPLRVNCDQWAALLHLSGYADTFVLHPSPCRIAGHSSTIGYTDGPLSKLDGRLLRGLRYVNRWLRKQTEAVTDRISRFE